MNLIRLTAAAALAALLAGCAGFNAQGVLTITYNTPQTTTTTVLTPGVTVLAP